MSLSNVKFIKKNQGNLRLLSKTTIGLTHNWQNEIRYLKSFVASEPKFDLFNNEVFLFFSELPWEIELETIDSWCCIPVQGHLEEIDDEEIEQMDLDSCEVYGLQEQIGLTELTNSALMDIFDAAENYFSEHQIEISRSWKIKISEDSKTGGLFDIQFYANI